MVVSPTPFEFSLQLQVYWWAHHQITALLMKEILLGCIGEMISLGGNPCHLCDSCTRSVTTIACIHEDKSTCPSNCSFPLVEWELMSSDAVHRGPAIKQGSAFVLHISQEMIAACLVVSGWTFLLML